MENTRINLTDRPFDIIIKMAEGNPGAINVLTQFIKEGHFIDPDNAFEGLGPIMVLDTYGIYGTDIYILHNDICKGELHKTLAVIRACQLGIFSKEKLKDACSRQDRSGCKIVPVNELYKKVRIKLPKFNSNAHGK